MAIIAGVVPDLMATRSLSIKLESTSLELSYDVAITQARESAHLRGHHDCVFASAGSRWQWNITFSFPARFNELTSDVAGDVEGLRDCTALRHQTRHFVRGREIDSLGQRLNLDLNSEFHSLNNCTAAIPEVAGSSRETSVTPVVKHTTLATCP